MSKYYDNISKEIRDYFKILEKVNEELITNHY